MDHFCNFVLCPSSYLFARWRSFVRFECRLNRFVLCFYLDLWHILKFGNFCWYYCIWKQKSKFEYWMNACVVINWELVDWLIDGLIKILIYLKVKYQNISNKFRLWDQCSLFLNVFNQSLHTTFRLEGGFDYCSAITISQ